MTTGLKRRVYRINKSFNRIIKKSELAFVRARTEFDKRKNRAEIWLRKNLKRASRSFLLFPFCMFAVLLVLVVVLTLISGQEKYKGGFIDGLLIEAHGLLLDILIISIILYAFQKNMEKKTDTRRRKEEIRYSGKITSEETKINVIANIKKLNEDGVTNIDLSNFNLTNTNLEKVNLGGGVLLRTDLRDSRLDEALLHGTNLTASILNGACLHKTELQKANLTGARIEEAVFSFANLNDAFLIGAKLKGCVFIRSDLLKVDFHGANLDGAMLIECKVLKSRNLTIKQLLRTSSLYNTQLDDRLMKQVEKERRELLEAPPRFHKKEDKT